MYKYIMQIRLSEKNYLTCMHTCLAVVNFCKLIREANILYQKDKI